VNRKLHCGDLRMDTGDDTSARLHDAAMTGDRVPDDTSCS